MRKSISILILLGLSAFTFGQNNPRPSDSRFWLNKASTFQAKAGDILVYEVKNNGEVYNFIATVKNFGEGISYTYDIPEKNLKGSTTIDAKAVKSAIKYSNVFVTPDAVSKDKTALWLSKDNFRGLGTSSKQTKMDFGNGLQSYMRESTSTEKIQYKGKEKIMTIYKIASNDSTGRKELWVLNDLNNPLIVKMEGAPTIRLKEVR